MRIGRTTERDENVGTTRRNVIRAGGLLALGAAAPSLTGCDLLGRGPEPAPTPDPLEPLLTGALALAARHRAAIGVDPSLTARLTPLADAHAAHAAELARVIGTALPSGTPTPGGTTPAGGDARQLLAGLRTAEQRGRDEAATACAQAPPERAALVGSIAAARASHLEALR